MDRKTMIDWWKYLLDCMEKGELESIKIQITKNNVADILKYLSN